MEQTSLPLGVGDHPGRGALPEQFLHKKDRLPEGRGVIAPQGMKGGKGGGQGAAGTVRIGGLKKAMGERFALHLTTDCAVKVVGGHGAIVSVAAFDQHAPQPLLA